MASPRKVNDGFMPRIGAPTALRLITHTITRLPPNAIPVNDKGIGTPRMRALAALVAAVAAVVGDSL